MTRKQRHSIAREIASKKGKPLDYLYFAYGSNLNFHAMARRCPHAVPLGKLVIQDWRLVFRGVADVEPRKGQVLAGGLWRITKPCLKALDIYEGYSETGRGFYDKVFFRLTDGRTAMLYRMTRRDLGMPSSYYLDVIKEGYLDFDLPMELLQKALIGTKAEMKPIHKSEGFGSMKWPKRARGSKIMSDDEWETDEEAEAEASEPDDADDFLLPANYGRDECNP